MRRTLQIAIFILVSFAFASGAAQESGDVEPVTAAYYYKVKWGHQDEFLDLYRRNHYPVLEEQIKGGRLLAVETFVPRFHGEGRADWTFISILVFKNWEAMNDNSREREIIRRLYPDQEKFRREEQRRFELLDAHWDIPLRKALMK